jgi:DNA polymerase-3 subunit alpha (Gram-positive type)
MQVSKAINPDYAKHKLGYICKNYKIPYDDTIAHRGDFDAEVLSKV